MSLLLQHADILIRTEKGYGTIPEGYLGIEDGRISYLGATAPEKEYDEKKEMRGKLLMPGLVNCHSHIAMVLMRGQGSGLPLHEWLFDTIFPIEDRLTREDVAAASRYAIMEMLAGGTTSFSDMYFFPEETVRAVAETGIRANLNRCVQCFDENETVAQNRQIKESLALFEQYHGAAEGRVHIDFSIHAEYTCKSHIVRAYSEECRARGGRMHIHLSETQREVDECRARYGVSPVEWFESLGTFDSPVAAAHCVALSDRDRALLRAHGVNVVHNPTSNLKLGSGVMDLGALLAAGINVALGTDGTASNNNLNMFEEMHLASLLHKGVTLDPTAAPDALVIDMATRNGALAQGRGDVGALEVGKKADLIALDLTRTHLYPNFDTAALVTASAQAGDVCMTMVDGKILYENGEFLTFDAERVRADMRAAVARLYR